MASVTRNIIMGFVREGSFKWLIKRRKSFEDDFGEIENFPSVGRNTIPELSPFANVVVHRCTKIVGVSSSELQKNFDEVASDSIKQPSCYARNFLEYCCFRALAFSTQVAGYLEDKNFCRLTFDMMLAWEFPAASSQQFLSVDEDVTVGVEAFSRIAPAVPIIANVIISDNLFEVLTASSDARLQFSVYDKYLSGLKRAMRKFKNQYESSLLSALCLSKGEKILEMNGAVTTQPVLQRTGISVWPGRLVLTDHALYFAPLRVVSYDKATQYDLSEDLNQVVKPELTGPWGARLFDKAILYKSLPLFEPVVMDFPERKGHTRREYWLAIIREILYAHRFIRKFQITGIEREKLLLKATHGILRIQALKELSLANPICHESLLLFNLCDQLPGGDLILEALAKISPTREIDRSNNSRTGSGGGWYSELAWGIASNLGFVFGTSSNVNEGGVCVGEIRVGEMSPLEGAVKVSRSNRKEVALAKATVDGVKVDGIGMNLAVMQELLSPYKEVVKFLFSLLHWEDSFKSSVFCLVTSYVILRGWFGYACALFLILMAIYIMILHFLGQGVKELIVEVHPSVSSLEQLLAVQKVISQSEEFLHNVNIVLLKIRGLIMFPQASKKFVFVLVVAALMFAFLPIKYLILLTFVGKFKQYSSPRKAGTERFERRMREWWFSIPATPVVLKRMKEDKKKRGL